jgi:hypothetical protein
MPVNSAPAPIATGPAEAGSTESDPLVARLTFPLKLGAAVAITALRNVAARNTSLGRISFMGNPSILRFAQLQA